MERSEKTRFVLLVNSVWNIGGVGAIMPLVQLLTSPETADSNRLIEWVLTTFELELTSQFVLWFGIGVLFIFVAGNALLAFVMWQSIIFSRFMGYNLSRRLYDTYIWQNYAYFLDHNSAELAKNLFSELSHVTSSALKPLMDMLVQGLLALGLVVFLVALNPLVASLVAGVMGGGYAVVYLLSRSIVGRAGRVKVRKTREKYRVAMDSFGAMKEMKLLGLEPRYSANFARASYLLERARGRTSAVSKLPKYVLESIAFGGILAAGLVAYMAGEGGSSLLPLLSAYIVAGYRMLPAFQGVFAGLASIKGSQPSVMLILNELEGYKNINPKERTERRIPFEDRIDIDTVTFSYDNTSRPVLKDIEWSIEKNTTVGIAGPTGCGKTTLVDVLAGLLVPQQGHIRIDGVDLSTVDMQEWRNHIGYVPQNIYLSDTSISKNIAFGLPDEEIDQGQVEFCAKLANLHDFVTTLDHGYETTLGERGIRLSGGQRQRIGIARALYRDPSVVVFDEATSALDSHTERAVMEAIAALMHKKTVIIIAHRLTTLKQADEIIVLKEGEIDARGTYRDLSRSHPHFMAPASEPGEA
jgi:ABC-type multidrug transport system fused ATPase/permease subunit